MNEQTCWEKIKGIDVDQIGAISLLDAALRYLKKDQIEIGDIYRNCGDSGRLTCAVIGLWSFDFLKNPRFEDGHLIGYNNYSFSNSEKSDIAHGLIEIIRSCRVDSDLDIHAIEYHYSACGRLYWLCGKTTELLLSKELEINPCSSLIQAIGIIVSHQYQGFLMPSTVDALIRIAKEDVAGLSNQAKETLLEDVVRMNKISHFYENHVCFDQ